MREAGIINYQLFLYQENFAQKYRKKTRCYTFNFEKLQVKTKIYCFIFIPLPFFKNQIGKLMAISIFQ